MSSLEGIFTLQPEELFIATALDRINNLTDAEAIALLPKINTILTEEAAAWADHCATVQAKHYTTIITQAHTRGVDIETIKAIGLHHLLVALPARFAVLAKLNSCDSLEPLSEALSNLRDEVSRGRARGGTGLGVSHRRVVYDQAFADAISEQEAILNDLENMRMAQLRQMRMMLLGARPSAFTSKKQVGTFVGVLEELGVNIEGLLPGASVEEA
ncbi:hypothetical protein Q7P35_001635 [Cladosporium inversicolor]